MSDKEARLSEELTALVSTGGGDWSDVVARSNALGSAQHRRRLITVAIVFAAFLLAAGTMVAAGRQFFGFTEQRPKTGRIPLIVVTGRTVTGLHGGSAQLAQAPNYSLAGWVAPVAALSPDGNQIAYSAWNWRKKEPPLMRLFSTETGDGVLAEGGYTAAWRGDGALAYARLTRPANTNLDTANIFVRTKLNEDARKWSAKAADYRVYGWAKQKLVGYSQHECETLEILVFDRPGKSRSLGYGFIIAIDPSGEKVAIAPNACGDDRLSGTLRIVRLRDGRVLAELSAARITAATRVKPEGGSVFLLYSGSWRGNMIVASASAGQLAFFRYAKGRLSIAQMMEIPKRYGWGMYEPVFLDKRATRIVGIADIPNKEHESTGQQLVVCDRTTRKCKAGKQTKKLIAVARNVSRPQRGW